jgi:hypothetical protein
VAGHHLKADLRSNPGRTCLGWRAIRGRRVHLKLAFVRYTIDVWLREFLFAHTANSQLSHKSVLRRCGMGPILRPVSSLILL